MKQFSRQLHTQAKTVKLRTVERAELRDRLQMYMEYHPLPTAQSAAVTKVSSVGATQPSFATAVQKWFMPFAGVTAAFLILVIPVVAEQAVPGDLLYPMKVQINEEVRSTLTFSSQEKIEWETTRIERRLAEARVLASQGKLTDELEQAVAQAVREHAENTEAEIAALRAVDADGAAVAEVSFASSLAIQSEVLSRSAGERPTDTPASPVLLAVQSEEQEASARSADSNPSYERMLALIESETTTAAELFTSIKESVPAEEVARIERRFADVQQKINRTVAAHTMTEEPFVAVLEVDTAATATGSEDSEAMMSMSLRRTDDTASTGTEGMTDEETVSEASTRSTTSPEEQEAIVAEEAAAKDKEGVAALRDILQDVKRLIRFMSDITVRETVSIDDWVPVSLTTDERVAGLQSLIAEIKDMQALVAAAQLSTEVSDEVEQKQQALVQAIFVIEELIAAGEIEQAEQQVQSAFLEAESLQSLVQTEDSASVETASSSEPAPDETASTSSSE